MHGAARPGHACRRRRRRRQRRRRKRDARRRVCKAGAAGAAKRAEYAAAAATAAAAEEAATAATAVCDALRRAAAGRPAGRGKSGVALIHGACAARTKPARSRNRHRVSGAAGGGCDARVSRHADRQTCRTARRLRARAGEIRAAADRAAASRHASAAAEVSVGAAATRSNCKHGAARCGYTRGCSAAAARSRSRRRSDGKRRAIRRPECDCEKRTSACGVAEGVCLARRAGAARKQRRDEAAAGRSGVRQAR